MKSFRKSQGDSLDLLLDTICNTFGAIILIAILVAIITQETPTPNAVLETTSAELIERQITTAQNEIEALREIAEGTHTANPRIAALSGRISELEREIHILENRETREISSENGSTEAMATMIEDDTASLRDADAEAARIANALQTVEENSKRLRERLANLEESIGEIESEQQQILRFPKERSADWSAIWVLFWGNKIYPLRDETFDENRSDFTITSNGEGTLYEIRRDRGHPIDAAGRIVGQFGKLPRSVGNWYFACLVNPDSVEAFTAFRDAAVSAGHSYGWEPHHQPLVLLVSEGGTKPSPL